MSKDIYNVNWLDLIPPSISADPQVQAISAAVTPQLQEVSQSIRECIILARLDELPEEVVDLLAWQHHVDFYDADLSINQKRNLVRTSIDAHRHKGTPYAVELVVKSILEDAVVQEWFEYGGEPYFFRVIKINGQITADMYPRLKKAIDTVKNTRSWLEGVSLSRTINSTLYLGVGQSIHKKIDISPVAFRMPEISSREYLGGAINVHKKIRI
ncbi:phage tail protein I [Pelosinus sp. UFO1]|uniref:phage tail protein I n=1 Tax=Pelosinus sp. UFO1 TaxID=484770 RepID=UPI0004D1550E|nr:phage tail protein I [Pelosinus sp. UFO1]AIF51266.1 phage tail protein I [Pelosinus sp. UFO1]